MSSMSAVKAKLSSVGNDYQQIIAKKDEQLRMQDERMSKQREEILRLRAELEAEKGEVPHCIADKEKADDESEEDESDRKLRTRQQEFRDVLNRYETGFPLKYKKFHNFIIHRRESKILGATESRQTRRSLVLEGSSCRALQSHSGRLNQLLKEVQGNSKLFVYLINENSNLINSRSETKNPGISEPRETPRAPILGGSSGQGSQPHPCRPKQPQVDAEHHKYLVECSRLESKLKKLQFNAPMYDMGNKSVKATSESNDHLVKTDTALRKNKPCKLKSAKSQPKNTLKDFKASGKTNGLVHRSLASKRKKKHQSKPHLAT